MYSISFSMRENRELGLFVVFAFGIRTAPPFSILFPNSAVGIRPCGFEAGMR